MAQPRLTLEIPSVQFSSVAQSCLTLCDPMNRSTPGLPVHHQLPEFTQTHVHPVGDAIQPSHPLLSPSPPAPNTSQHQGLFQWVSSSQEAAKVLEFQLQHQSNEHPGLISFRMDWLDLLAVQGTLKSPPLGGHYLGNRQPTHPGQPGFFSRWDSWFRRRAMLSGKFLSWNTPSCSAR